MKRLVRRYFLSLCALLLALVIAASGCSTPAPTQTPAPVPTVASKPAPTQGPTAEPVATPKPTAVVSPKPEGTLRIAWDDLGAPRWLPNQNSTTYLGLVQGVYEFLIARKVPTRELVPQIADKWELSSDGLAWTFYVHKGIQFHDNWGELTAEDVKFSVELAGKEGSVASDAGTFKKLIGNMEVVNPYQLVIRSSSVNVTLPYVMTNALPNIPIVSKKYVQSVGEDAAGARPIGTGPYKFAEVKPGSYVKLDALDSHWRQTAQFKTVLNTVVPEQSTRLAMLKTGELDIAPISLSYKKEAKAMGVELRSQPAVNQAFITFGGQYLTDRPTYNPNVPWVGPTPERALKVRQALNMAVNKQEIIDNIFQGEGQQLSVVPGIVTLPWDDPAWKPYPYDPEGARKLLADAGYPNGLEITMRLTPYPQLPEAVDMAEAVAMYWEKIGIRVKRVSMDYNVDRTDVVARKLAGIANPRGYAFQDEPPLQVIIRSDAPANWIMESKYIDDLMVKAAAEPNYEKRKAMYHDLGKFLYEGYYSVPIALRNNLWGVSNKVGQLANLNGYGLLVNVEYITRK